MMTLISSEEADGFMGVRSVRVGSLMSAEEAEAEHTAILQAGGGIVASIVALPVHMRRISPSTREVSPSRDVHHAREYGDYGWRNGDGSPPMYHSRNESRSEAWNRVHIMPCLAAPPLESQILAA